VVPIGEDLVAALREHRKEQAAQRLALGLGGGDLVFRWPDGSRRMPESFTRHFVADQKGLGLPRLTLHGCRHTFASNLIDLGVGPSIIKELMGHSDVRLLNIYGHAHEASRTEAAAAPSRALA